MNNDIFNQKNDKNLINNKIQKIQKFIDNFYINNLSSEEKIKILKEMIKQLNK